MPRRLLGAALFFALRVASRLWHGCAPARRQRVVAWLAQQHLAFSRTQLTLLTRLRAAALGDAREPPPGWLQAHARLQFQDTMDNLWGLSATEAQLRQRVGLTGVQGLLEAQRQGPVLVLFGHFFGYELALMRLACEVRGAVLYDTIDGLGDGVERAWSRFGQACLVPSRPVRPAVRRLLEQARDGRVLALGVDARVWSAQGGLRTLSRIVPMLHRELVPSVYWLSVCPRAEGAGYDAWLTPLATPDATTAALQGTVRATLAAEVRARAVSYAWTR